MNTKLATAFISTKDYLEGEKIALFAMNTGLFHSQLFHFIYLREYLIASFRQRIFSYL
ncbi:MAG: hypothetical protein QNJ68_08915 [Microcoleaceae cyanobacterium MO_207.B10]|nr:hypothetical protein [Microcoleaceae cyanobacterium MO_207.B10]